MEEHKLKLTTLHTQLLLQIQNEIIAQELKEKVLATQNELQSTKITLKKVKNEFEITKTKFESTQSGLQATQTKLLAMEKELEATKMELKNTQERLTSCKKDAEQKEEQIIFLRDGITKQMELVQTNVNNHIDIVVKHNKEGFKGNQKITEDLSIKQTEDAKKQLEGVEKNLKIEIKQSEENILKLIEVVLKENQENLFKNSREIAEDLTTNQFETIQKHLKSVEDNVVQEITVLQNKNENAFKLNQRAAKNLADVAFERFQKYFETVEENLNKRVGVGLEGFDKQIVTFRKCNEEWMNESLKQVDNVQLHIEETKRKLFDKIENVQKQNENGFKLNQQIAERFASHFSKHDKVSYDTKVTLETVFKSLESNQILKSVEINEQNPPLFEQINPIDINGTRLEFTKLNELVGSVQKRNDMNYDERYKLLLNKMEDGQIYRIDDKQLIFKLHLPRGRREFWIQHRRDIASLAKQYEKHMTVKTDQLVAFDNKSMQNDCQIYFGSLVNWNIGNSKMFMYPNNEMGDKLLLKYAKWNYDVDIELYLSNKNEIIFFFKKN